MKSFEPIIVTTGINIENPAHLYNRKYLRVVFDKLIFYPSFLVKMPGAFFTMSLSKLISLIFFRSLTISLALESVTFIYSPVSIPLL